MIKLDEIITDLEFVNDGFYEAYYNPLKQETVFPDIEECKTIDEDELTELIMLPTKYEINEYSMMESFIETIEDVKLYNQLYMAINGRGAFRRFKDTCINHEIIDDWYKFRDDKFKEIAITWCKENNIDFEE